MGLIGGEKSNTGMSQYTSTQFSFRLNLVLFLLIAVNIVNTIYPKGMGYNTEDYVGFGYQLSKYINAAIIVVMLPSLCRRIRFFSNMRYMVIMITIYMIIAHESEIYYDFNAIARSLLICLSFVFFEDVLRNNQISRLLLYGYITSAIINIAYLVITQDRLGTAIDNEGYVGGGQSIANGLIFLFPLIFLVLKDKISAFIFIFLGIVIIISLRRTAILSYLLCLPFVYKTISRQISRKTAIIFILLFAIISYYIVHNYWFVIENRFSDMFEANESGYYGSSRTGWWEVLVNKFIENPQKWLFGFGLGNVAKTMQEAGFPYGSAHNDYLEIIYTFGLIGGLMWFFTIIKAYHLSKNIYSKGVKTLLYMYIISYLIFAIGSGAFYNINFISIAIFLNLISSHQYH